MFTSIKKTMKNKCYSCNKEKECILITLPDGEVPYCKECLNKYFKKCKIAFGDKIICHKHSILKKNIT